MMIQVTSGPIDVAAARAAVEDDGFGAILVFEGVGRDNADGKRVTHLAYEAYEEMSLREMNVIAAEIKERWPQCAISMVHRTGVVKIGEPSVVIAVGTPHRGECYAASRYAIDELKARVPIWKKEHYENGSVWKANTTG
ncbi:MAG: molybdenum cofactor biosynthesis protein MoaE [Proteobacteria bacterium]|jgi:molybdopterin synthase catalytic subunit|nr:molybdenum cofactor biosynthesis protein MoaE [Pseudomonadota bacterium]